MILNAGITKVFYFVPYRKTDGVELLSAAGVEVFRLSASYSLIQVR
jgi:hypothetical protein